MSKAKTLVSVRVTQSFRDRGQTYLRGEVLHVRQALAAEWRRHGVVVLHKLTRELPTKCERRHFA